MALMGLQPVEVEPGVTSLADRAHAAIQERLIMLDIRPNAVIAETELAQEFGVGRTPVREALKRLEAERLVVSFPRRGTFAASVDVADLGHITEIRAALEPVAARRAAESTSPTLRQLFLDMADKTEVLDIRDIGKHELMRWDLTVHRTIYRAARNPHLEDVLVRYDNLATRIFCLFLERLPSVAQHVGEHTQLLRAIADGCGDAAAEIARDHVVGFEKAVRAAL
jgi:DNA-binding GntR family transcriptional regulator